MRVTQTTAPARDYRLYGKREYLTSLVKRIDAAGPKSRILLMAMSFDPDEPEVLRVAESLLRAAQRGAIIYFGFDARSFMHPNGKPGPTWYRPSRLAPLLFHFDLPKNPAPPYKLKKQILDKLRTFPNVTAVIVNHPHRPLSVPFAGRSHIKLAVIDDYLLIGGCNLDHPDYPDLMIGWREQSVASELYERMTHALQVGNIRAALDGVDRTIRVDDTTKIFVDSGVRGQSLIMREALALIDSAQEWLVITCQFFPNSITGDHLLAARKRGVKVRILYSYLWDSGTIDGTIQFVSQVIERRRLPPEMFKDELPKGKPKLHAKLIACDAGVVIGSHNYVNAGVRFGTAEIAFRSDDSGLAQQAKNHIIKQL